MHIDLHIYKEANCSNGYSNAIQLNQMIVEKTHHNRLSTPVSSICEVRLAFNDSIVLRVMDDSSKFVIFHFDWKGQELDRHTTDNPENSMCFIEDRSVVVTDVNQDRITLTNL
jgi:hypothetical protein